MQVCTYLHMIMETPFGFASARAKPILPVHIYLHKYSSTYVCACGPVDIISVVTISRIITRF